MEGDAHISRFKFKTNIYIKKTIYITHLSRHQNKIANNFTFAVIEVLLQIETACNSISYILQQKINT
jgi:hypothetical protein